MNNEPKGRILIVDDVEENLHYMTRLLGMNGYQVRAVTSGQEGLVEARQYQPHLILLDILMPDMNGYTVCKRLKADERTADIPVIFVSVLEEMFDKVRAFSYGAVDYLIKPFASEEILARIETHLSLQNLQRTVQQESRQLQQEVERRRREETARRESEQFSASLLENAPNPIVVINPDSSIRYVNPAFERLTGFAASEMMHCKAPYPWWAADSWQSVQSTFTEILHTGAKRLEMPFQTSRGGRFWVEVTSTPVMEAGRLQYYLSNWLDITERKQAEFALRESEARYRTLFEEAPVALWEEDLSAVKAYLDRLRVTEEIEDFAAYLGQHPEVARHCLELIRVVDVNRAGLKLYGVAEKEAMLGRIDRIFSLESLESFRKELMVIARGDSRHARQFTVRHNITGDIFYLDLNWAVVPGHEQSYDKVLVCLIDITESKRMYDQMQKDARTKAILLQEVNHRVQNNLGGIIGMLYATQNYVEEMGESPACRAVFAEVLQRIESLAAVHRILSESEWSPLSLEEIVRQIIQIALDILPPGKEVITEIRSDQPVYVTPKQANSLAMVINELMTNAIKYTLLRRNQTHITIHIAATAETIYLEFGDDGPGFPAELTQGDLDSRRNLGIYLVRSLVQDGLRGEVKFWNRSGAVATIQFPAALDTK